jgi:ATP-dependent exoDNAse (exonuclease V) alpha subunit
MQKMIKNYTLNVEQTRAFKLVAQHSIELNADPLRMFIGGPGGTGKSRVIDALKDFFEARGEKRRFRLSSYTGVAARNISGMTLHAALGMGQKEKKQKTGKALRDLMAIWDGVDYLFIDEISMVGCALLYDVSSALGAARGSTLAFGGINIIFAGDFS